MWRLFGTNLISAPRNLVAGGKPFPISQSSCFEIRTNSAPIRAPIYLNSPGKYYLGNDIEVGGDNGIIIGSSNVHLDLQGYSITAVSDDERAVSRCAISIRRGAHVTVQNGSIRGFMVGLSGTACDHLKISDLSVTRSRRIGINVGGLSCRVSGCSVSDIRGNPSEAYAVGINVARGADIVIEGNRVSEIYRQEGCPPEVKGEGCAIILNAASERCSVLSNVVTNQHNRSGTIGVFGGRAGHHTLKDNFVRGYECALQGGGFEIGPCDAIGNSLWLPEPLPRSKGISISFGVVRDNTVVGYAA